MKTHTVVDFWNAYCFKLLTKHKDWWGIGATRNGALFQVICSKHIDEITGRSCVTEVITYKEFRLILETYFIKAKERIIQGHSFSLNYKLGKIAARRVDRNYNKKTIDYLETQKQPKVWSEEKQKMVASVVVYHQSEDWCMIGWHKARKVQNESVYSFSITKNLKTGNGFNQMLNQALVKNPRIKYRYIHYPKTLANGL